MRLLRVDSDVDAAAWVIARNNPRSAMKFYDAIDQTYRELSDHPARWLRYELNEPRLSDLRKCAVSVFRNYLVFYRIDADAVEIMRVLHGARDIPAVLVDLTDDEG